MAERKENVVLFPFMAQGHIIPFLALALQIERRGYNITFVNTPLNIKKLRPSLPPDSTIRFLEIPFNSSEHGLPPGVENTDVLVYPIIYDFLQATLCLKPTFRKLLSDLIAAQGGDPPLCVIGDMFFGWMAEVVQELGVFHAVFSGAGGFGLACYRSFWLNLPHQKTDSQEFSLPDFPESGRFHATQLTSNLITADGTDVCSAYLQREIPKWSISDGMLFNTVEELDMMGLNYFRSQLGRPVWPVGPILLSVNNRAPTDKAAGITPEQCLEWLDAKPPNSVLYISFGSQNTITASQMMQLAKALEASRKNFIWVVRPPLGFDINAEFNAQEWLPEGFIRRMVDEEKRGLIVLQWAPQVEILSHDSVAAFLTHCGWNSVLEALRGGVPLLGWPMAAEQFYNAKFLDEEGGVCVEVARGTSFDVRHEDIVHKIELVMGEGHRGKEMRRKAMQAKEMMKDATRDEVGFKGSSVKALDEFFNAALLKKKENKKKQIGNGGNSEF